MTGTEAGVKTDERCCHETGLTTVALYGTAGAIERSFMGFSLGNALGLQLEDIPRVQ